MEVVFTDKAKSKLIPILFPSSQANLGCGNISLIEETGFGLYSDMVDGDLSSFW